LSENITSRCIILQTGNSVGDFPGLNQGRQKRRCQKEKPALNKAGFAGFGALARAGLAP
jgi:hypothetical protein